MAAAGVRASWNEATPPVFAEGSPDSASTEPAEWPAQPSWAQVQGRRPARTAKARRMAAAGGSGPGPAATAAAEPPPPPAFNAQQAAGPDATRTGFCFSTPGGSSVRRSKARSPGLAAAAPSPAFTTSSATSMAWSPFPSSSAEAATAFGGATTPVPPGSATPTSAPAQDNGADGGQDSSADDVAADLRSRLNLGADGAEGADRDSLKDKLRSVLHAGPPAAAQREQEPQLVDDAPQWAATAAAAAGAGGSQASDAGFCFVFGASVPSPTAARAALRKKGGSPAPRDGPPSFAATSRPSSAASAGASFMATSAAGSMPAAQQAQFAAPAYGPADSEATSATGPAAGTFVFGAANGSPGTQRARHRARQSSRSPPQQPSKPAAADAASPSPAARSTEPLREQQPHQPPAGQQQQAGCVRLGDVGKPSVGDRATTSPGFAAGGEGGAARRVTRRSKAAGAQPRSAGKTAASKPASSAQEPVRPVPAAAYAVAPDAVPSAAFGGAGLTPQCQAAYSMCEMYRSQGNEAFRDADYNTAYDLYTKSLHALWPHPPLHPRLALLLSNRAAALLSQGKPLSALADCQMGLKYDPSLMRCALRVATCHSRMGNFDVAFQSVQKLREAAAGNPEHLKEIALKYKDLQEQEKQMYEALRSLGHALSPPSRDKATGAPLQRSASGGGLSRAGSAVPPATSDAYWEALKKVDDIAPHVPHAELLVAAKAEGLLRVGKHVKARDFCDQPVHQDEAEARREAARSVPWRLWVRAQCSWHEGDASGDLKQQLQELRQALERLEEQEGGATVGSDGAAGSAFFPAGAAPAPASRQEQRRQVQLRQLVGLPSAKDVRGLIQGLEAADRLRLEGNEAVKAGQAAEAVKKYSEALAANGLSATIAAVLLSNRAAAHQHLKQRAQAVADCCRSLALNPGFAKAHSRLATLLSELGHHGEAATALEAAIAVPGVCAADKRDYQQRLAREQAAAKRGASRSLMGSKAAPVDHYKMLGLERTAGTEDVRRAYKKLALQLHPDKAASSCRVSARCCGCGTPTFEAVAALHRLSERATWLFKLLGEANEVLSDTSKRRELDHSLNAWAAGSFGNGFSSYYGDAADSDEDVDAFFGGLFGRRPRAGTGAGYGAGGAAGAYSRGYGSSAYGGYGAGGYGGGGGHGGGQSSRGGYGGGGTRYWAY